MSTGAVAAIVVAVLVVIAVVAVWTMSGGAPRSGRLKHRFGPEYERTLAQHDGDAKAAGKELSDRVKRYGGLERRPLTAAEREQYTARWRAVQAQFVEDPAKALHQADQLVAQVATERGFPAAGSPEHFDALSVHHATQLQGYRRAHALAEHASAGGEGATEDLRQSLIGARGLFDELLSDSGTASTRTRPAQAPDTPAAESAPEHPRAEDESAPEPAGVGAGTRSDEDAGSAEDGTGRSTLGHRFAALTGSVRKGDDGSGRA